MTWYIVIITHTFDYVLLLRGSDGRANQDLEFQYQASCQIVLMGCASFASPLLRNCLLTGETSRVV